MSDEANFEIIAGTYEEYLLGYIYSAEKKTLTQSFASHDHSGSVRCLAASGHYLASGASDDRIIIYDLKARKEHCMLTHHDGTISALAFTSNHSHIISASQSGALAIVRVGNWQLEKLWGKAHKEGGAILDITVHSSGKLALTLGNDGTIHTWNLVKGRIAYVINLKTKCKDSKSVERILFAPDDTTFVISGGKFTEIWSIEMGGVLKVIEHDQKVTCIAWLDIETLFVGYEDGNMATVDVKSGEKTSKKGHDGRIKAAQCNKGHIITASSTGEIKVWSRKMKELSHITTGCRITCLIVADCSVKVKKEESNEMEVVEEVSPKKPVRSTVIVEVEESESENDKVEVIKKRKNNKKNVTQRKVQKKKKKLGVDSNEKPKAMNMMKKNKSTQGANLAPKKKKKKITNNEN